MRKINCSGFFCTLFVVCGLLQAAFVNACPNPGCSCGASVCENFKNGICSIYACEAPIKKRPSHVSQNAPVSKEPPVNTPQE